MTPEHVKGLLDKMTENWAKELQAAIREENEACARILDDAAQEFNRLRDPGMANHCRSKASAIRARIKD